MGENWENLRDQLFSLSKKAERSADDLNLAISALDNPHWEVQLEAVHYLSKTPPDQEIALKVSKLWQSPQQTLRQLVAKCLGALGAEPQMEVLEQLLADEYPVVRKRAAEAIAAIWSRSEGEQ